MRVPQFFTSYHSASVSLTVTNSNSIDVVHNSVSVTYVVFLEECEVANDSHPHQESGGP